MGYERKVRLYHTAKPGRAGREVPPLRGQILGGISLSNSPISLQNRSPCAQRSSRRDTDHVLQYTAVQLYGLRGVKANPYQIMAHTRIALVRRCTQPGRVASSAATSRCRARHRALAAPLLSSLTPQPSPTSGRSAHSGRRLRPPQAATSRRQVARRAAPGCASCSGSERSRQLTQSRPAGRPECGLPRRTHRRSRSAPVHQEAAPAFVRERVVPAKMTHTKVALFRRDCSSGIK